MAMAWKLEQAGDGRKVINISDKVDTSHIVATTIEDASHLSSR